MGTETDDQTAMAEDAPMLNSNSHARKQSVADEHESYSSIHRSYSDAMDGPSLSKEKEDTSGFKLFAKMSRRQKYSLILITLAIFLSSVAFSLLGPFYQTEAVKRGMSITTVGFVFGIYQAVIFLTSPLYGNFLVKLGPRFVFVAGIFVGGSCNILFGALKYCPSGTPFTVMSILVRAVEALGFSGYITASYAIVSNEFKENVGFTFSILETGSGLGFMLGPTIGGALYELGGFALPFYFAGVGVLLNGLAVYKFLPTVDDFSNERKGSMLTMLRSPMVVIPIISMVMGTLGITSYDATFASHLQSLGFSVGILGVFFGGLSLVYSVMSSLWGYISDTKNIQAPLIVGGHFVFGMGFLILGPSFLFSFIPFGLPTIIVGLGCLGVSLGCLYVPTMKCMVIGAIEIGFENNIDTFAIVSGLFNSFHTLGGFIGPVCVGYLVQEYGYPVGYTVVGLGNIFMMVVTIVFFTLRRMNKRKNVSKIDDSDVKVHVSNLRRHSLSLSLGTA